MQTRRDQLQAYRFQNRRALAALVTGHPNVLEPPMRRLTVTTISGVMIAILIAVGFGLVALIKPSPGDSWRNPGTIIVENQSGARYVLIDGVLHPVLNYPSAVLAVGMRQNATVAHVDQSTLAGVKRGPTIGIPQLPDSLPPADGLVTAPWTVCSRLRAASGSSSSLTARVTLIAGSDARAASLPAGAAALVQAVGDSSWYLLTGGTRHEIASNAALAALGLGNVTPLAVGHAFLDAIPAGQPLQAPKIRDAGTTADYRVGNQRVTVGQLLQTGPTQFTVVLADGVSAVTPVEADLLQTLRIGPGRSTLPPVRTTTAAALDAGTSKRQWQHDVLPQVNELPPTVPPVPALADQRGGLCAVYRSGAADPTFAVPASQLPTFQSTATTESATSARGKADAVVLPPGGGAIVRSANGAQPVYLVAYPGKKYAATSLSVLKALGYAGVHPTPLPDQLLSLMTPGPPLDPAAALRRATG